MDDHVLKHWESQVKKHGSSHNASWGDIYAIDLEIAVISEYIEEGSIVLDAGCANGFSTFIIAEKNKVKKIFGIDFSGEMIKQANSAKEKTVQDYEATFQVGDIRKLPFEDGCFDVVYTTRVLINLLAWEEQKLGIEECIRVCKPEGRIIFSEAFWEPLVLLNSMRQLVSLPPLVEHDFNRYLKKTLLREFLSSKGYKFNIVDFSSVYYLGSRFLRELVTRAEDYPGYSNPVNELFCNIEKKYSGGNFGIQQAFVVDK